MWRCGVVVITTAQLHSTEPELRFCAGSNPACGISEIRDGEDLWQWSRLEIRLNTFRWSTMPPKQFIIIIIIIIRRLELFIVYRSSSDLPPQIARIHHNKMQLWPLVVTKLSRHLAAVLVKECYFSYSVRISSWTKVWGATWRVLLS